MRCCIQSVIYHPGLVGRWAESSYGAGRISMMVGNSGALDDQQLTVPNDITD